LRASKPIKVETDSKGNLRTIKKGTTVQIVRVEGRWRIDDEWWRRKPISRLYYQVLLANEHRITIFQDLINDRWYEQNYA